MKRSKTIGLVAMSASVVALTACEEPAVDAAVFETLSQCLANGDVDIYPSAWPEVTHKQYMDEYGDQLEDLGAYYDNAKLTIAVPSYSNINSIEDLKGKVRVLVRLRPLSPLTADLRLLQVRDLLSPGEVAADPGVQQLIRDERARWRGLDLGWETARIRRACATRTRGYLLAGSRTSCA